MFNNTSPSNSCELQAEFPWRLFRDIAFRLSTHWPWTGGFTLTGQYNTSRWSCRLEPELAGQSEKQRLAHTNIHHTFAFKHHIMMACRHSCHSFIHSFIPCAHSPIHLLTRSCKHAWKAFMSWIFVHYTSFHSLQWHALPSFMSSISCSSFISFVSFISSMSFDRFIHSIHVMHFMRLSHFIPFAWFVSIVSQFYHSFIRFTAFHSLPPIHATPLHVVHSSELIHSFFLSFIHQLICSFLPSFLPSCLHAFIHARFMS